MTDDSTPGGWAPLTPPGGTPMAPGPQMPPPPSRPPLLQRNEPAPPGAATRPPPEQLAPTEVRARVSGWMWPMIAVTALVVGLVGGIAGAVGYAEYNDEPEIAGTVSDGLAGVDTVDTPPLPADDGSVAAVAQELLPSTVQIVARFGGDGGGATGSGFIVDKQGHIVTNNHVIQEAAESDSGIEIVDQEGNTYEATVVGRSSTYDLAVLFSEGAKQLPPAALGNSESLLIGEGVVAFGAPLGLSSTVTSGIVSSKNRPVSTGNAADDNSYINAVQTDAAINPGNSGGPLVDLRGRVVGVNTAIATTGGGLGGSSGNIGVGFAIPIEQVRITTDQILRNGEAYFPVIGAEVRTGGDDGDGALISSVLDDSPSAAAGLQEGDLIVAVGDQRITGGIELIVAIRRNQPGQTLQFTYERGGQESTAEITLGRRTG